MNNVLELSPEQLAVWIRQAQGGDREAMAQILTAHEQPVLRVALRMMGRHEDAQDAAQEVFLRLYRALGQFEDGRAFRPLGVISVAGAEPSVTAFEEALKKLDTPPPANPQSNVEVVIYVVGATRPGGADALAPGLEPVIKQMRSVCQYAHYRVLDAQIIRTRPYTPEQRRTASARGQLQHPTKEATFTCNTSLDVRPDEDAKGRVFHFLQFDFGCANIHSPKEYQVVIHADFDVREGQKAVVGKSSIRDDSAVFLVVTARQLD